MKIILIAGLLILLILPGCTQMSEPEAIVSAYFTAWDQHSYSTMYSLMSDGFKKLEPSAASPDSFRIYAELQSIDKVKILFVREISNGEGQATVDYEVEFTTQGKKIPFRGSYTLKYRSNDAQPGWKLIHPYGEHIDTS